MKNNKYSMFKDTDKMIYLILKEYLNLVDIEYKDVSKEFFSNKKIWLDIFIEEDCDYHSMEHKEYVDMINARNKRQFVGNKRNKIKGLLKCLGMGDFNGIEGSSN